MIDFTIETHIERSAAEVFGTRVGQVPQREPARHQTAGEPPGAKVKMRLDTKGRWVAVLPEDESPEAAESAAPPAKADDTDQARRRDPTP